MQTQLDRPDGWMSRRNALKAGAAIGLLGTIPARTLAARHTPIALSTPQELQDIANDLDADYELVNDIDMSGFAFEPIGGPGIADTFTGSLLGNGHTISNLTIDRPSESTVGMFWRNRGLIQGVNLTNVSVTGRSSVGGVVGVNSGPGLAGGGLSQLSVTGSVAGSFAGGIAGVNIGWISQCSTAVAVEGFESGGIVGMNSWGGDIADSYSSGPVTGEWVAGGIAGINDSGWVRRTYSASPVAATVEGGLIAQNDSPGFVQGSYWDTDITPVGIAEGPIDDAVGLTTAQMSGPAAQDNMPAFNWETVWATTPSYPRLQWELTDPAVAIRALQDDVEALGLARGTRRRLLATLRAAENSIARGNHRAARNQLRAFTNQVRAQRGKRIAPADADELIAAAAAVIEAL